ncbi:MAG TPA: MBL fold metallo-hydrolase [Thermoleophilaceae bacterium]
MKLTWLGWAGVELAAGQSTLVIDPLEDAAAVFAPLGPAATEALPAIVPPTASTAVAGLLTHLHRDHADAAALTAALAPGAPVLEPEAGGGDKIENLALAQADHELNEAGLDRRRLKPWESVDVGPFHVTALPAVDGIGDPQVSWLVEVDGVRVLHLGDTIFHGYWWRMARRHGPFDVVCVPVNGAVLSFPHRQPPSPFTGALDPEQAAVAVEILGSRVAIPMHAQGYDIPDVYEPAADAVAKFEAAADARGVPVQALDVGQDLSALPVSLTDIR